MYPENVEKKSCVIKSGLYATPFNPFPVKPWFLVCQQYKQFLLFPHSFLPVNRELSAAYIKFEIVICELLEFGRV